MKIIIISIMVAIAQAIPDASLYYNGPPPILTRNAQAREPKLFNASVKVDHFNPNDNRTYQMRFYASNDLFQAGGPIMIYLGGEWVISANTLTGGLFYDVARQLKAFMLYTEHRYYGNSWPTPDFTTENLKYLTSAQALEDVVQIIRQFKKSPNFENSKVILFGCSYSASLATWARLKYPDLIDAVYASSGPLLAVDNFKEYMEIVSGNILVESPACWNTISEGIEEMEQLMRTAEGTQMLSSILGTCVQIRNYEPYRSFIFKQIGFSFAGMIQYAQPGTIKNKCLQLLSLPGSSLQKLAAFTKPQGCRSDYDSDIRWFQSTAATSVNLRPWLYQQCTEFGFFQTATSKAQPFGFNWDVDAFHIMCKDAFNIDTWSILNGIANTNRNYEGLNPRITKVVSVHGKVDPWHTIGLQKDLNVDAPVITVPCSSHCGDLGSISSADPHDLLQAKRRAVNYIIDWVR